eukprot:NODE_359_length_908_cov_1203.953905_g351_i0.p1 GENE.NODE_359_length_908_cov_1203.953905_g351_i0~~NODE_359_length_908_cov_1203.953905_g351_i0.p1  ORF type:complete len:234 (-),score=64.56 NODE_359_length_908_cov_1203.953905_g351_i0:205-858(-)
MVKYAREPNQQMQTRTAKARGSDLRVHFKNTRETVNAVKGMSLKKAQQYLKDVLRHKRCIPFRRFCYAVGRTPQAKEWKTNTGRWPQKSVKILQALLKNAESNAELKALDLDKLYITHIQANRAQKQRRRTYRAHGRINPYMSSPSHVEVVLTQKQVPVKPPRTKWVKNYPKGKQIGWRNINKRLLRRKADGRRKPFGMWPKKKRSTKPTKKSDAKK